MRVFVRLSTFFIAFLLVLFVAVPTRAEFNPVGSIAEFEQSAVSCANTSGGACVENLSLYQMTTVFPSTMTCALTGLMGCDTITVQGRLKNFQKSPLGMSTQVIAYLFQKPPITTGQYMAWMGQRAHIVPEAYAQGITYSRLLPILPLWKTFRDIAFMMLTVILMFAGVMIMFRQKINPQTVAKVENTIPNIVITMILIAFSLPIAAFIIDIMYVVIAAGILVIGSAVHDPNVTAAVKDFTTGGAMVLLGKTLVPALIPWKLGLSAVDIDSTTAGQAASWGGSTVASAVGLSIVKGGAATMGWILVPLLAGAATYSGYKADDVGVGILTALSPILVLVLAIILLALFFRLLFILLSAYIQLIISIILGPIILLWNAVPGQSSFSNWWKGIVGNCLAFVITAVMLYLGWAISASLGTQAFWVPPLLIQGKGVPQVVSGLIAIGLLTLIPQFITMAKGAIGAKSMFQVGPGSLTQPITSGLMQGVQTLSQFHMASPALKGIKEWIGGKK